MKNRNSKLPFNKTSFYRIARKRFIIQRAVVAPIITEGLSRIQMLQSQSNNPYMGLVVATMIATEAINTFGNAAKVMGNDL